MRDGEQGKQTEILAGLHDTERISIMNRICRVVPVP